MRTYSEKTLRNFKKNEDRPWDAVWTQNELDILNESGDLKFKELCLLIPTKTKDEIYWKKYADQIALKIEKWLLEKKVQVFRPSLLCAKSVGGLYSKKEAEQALSMLMKDGKVIQDPDTKEYVCMANLNGKLKRKYNRIAKINSESLKPTKKSTFRLILDILRDVWFN